MAAKKNSLVANINRRKKKGTSRTKSSSTVSSDAYEAMQRGWPKQGKKKAKKTTAKKASKKSSAKKATRKPSAKKAKTGRKKARAK